MIPSTDEHLMLEYQGGSSAAFDELYGRYEHKIYNYLVYLVRDSERSAELFQDTFLQLHRSRASYDPTRGFAPWIFSIARNLGLNELRRLKRRRGLIDEGVDAATQPDTRGDPERELVHKTMREDLAGALRGLGDDQRESILLSFYGGLKYSEIAEVSGTTEDAVKQRVRRGMGTLREQLKSHLRSD